MQLPQYRNNVAPKIEKALIFFLVICPLFVLTIGGWMSGMLFLTSILSLYLLLNLESTNKLEPNLLSSKKWHIALVISLASSIAATFLGHLFRNSWNWPDYDTPSRFLIAAPIFLIIFKRKLPILNYWLWAIPLTLIITWVLMPYLPKTGWANDPSRLTTSMVDPLTFGRICLTFSLISLFLMPLNRNKVWLISVIQILGVIIGIYLSVRSGSRTGWLVVPIVIMILFIAYGPKNKLVALAIAAIISIGGTVAAYQLSNTVKDRVNIAISEIQGYKFEEMNPDTSVGMRISFARMGLYYFSLSPFSGNTKEDLIKHKNDSEITRYASEYTRDFPINAQFHNEFTTNTVKNGFGGFISTALIFFVPFGLFISGLLKQCSRKFALVGIAYLSCELISAMSTEVIGLKFTASLYSILITCLCATVLYMMSSDNSSDIISQTKTKN
jgi:O-antigen ligase